MWRFYIVDTVIFLFGGSGDALVFDAAVTFFFGGSGDVLNRAAAAHHP